MQEDKSGLCTPVTNGSNRNIRDSNLNWNGAPVELNTTQI